jgi:hypothetical protein
MKGIRTIVFVFVPIYVEITRARAQKQAAVVSSRAQQWAPEQSSDMNGDTRQGLRGWRRANQSPTNDPPFWTWFVDNPRPSSSHRF